MQFQLLIRTVSDYPMMIMACQRKFFISLLFQKIILIKDLKLTYFSSPNFLYIALMLRYSRQFQMMNSYFSRCGINMNSLLQKQSGFDARIWLKFGISFEAGIGF